MSRSTEMYAAGPVSGTWLDLAYGEWCARDIRGEHNAHVEAYYAWRSRQTPGDAARFLGVEGLR